MQQRSEQQRAEREFAAVERRYTSLVVAAFLNGATPAEIEPFLSDDRLRNETCIRLIGVFTDGLTTLTEVGKEIERDSSFDSLKPLLLRTTLKRLPLVMKDYVTKRIMCDRIRKELRVVDASDDYNDDTKVNLDSSPHRDRSQEKAEEAKEPKEEQETKETTHIDTSGMNHQEAFKRMNAEIGRMIRDEQDRNRRAFFDYARDHKDELPPDKPWLAFVQGTFRQAGKTYSEARSGIDDDVIYCEHVREAGHRGVPVPAMLTTIPLCADEHSMAHVTATIASTGDVQGKQRLFQQYISSTPAAALSREEFFGRVLKCTLLEKEPQFLVDTGARFMQVTNALPT